jgi:hypothetical protein
MIINIDDKPKTKMSYPSKISQSMSKETGNALHKQVSRKEINLKKEIKRSITKDHKVVSNNNANKDQTNSSTLPEI